MDKIVYIVKSIYGQYEDINWYINGIFENYEDALECERDILIKIKEQKEEKCPIDGFEIWDDIPDDMSDEDVDKILDWQNRIRDADEFEECFVKEFPLNKVIDI